MGCWGRGVKVGVGVGEGRRGGRINGKQIDGSGKSTSTTFNPQHSFVIKETGSQAARWRWQWRSLAKACLPCFA